MTIGELAGLEYDDEVKLQEESSLTETSSMSSYSEDPQFLTKKQKSEHLKVQKQSADDDNTSEQLSVTSQEKR